MSMHGPARPPLPTLPRGHWNCWRAPRSALSPLPLTPLRSRRPRCFGSGTTRGVPDATCTLFFFALDRHGCCPDQLPTARLPAWESADAREGVAGHDPVLRGADVLDEHGCLRDVP